MKKTITLAIILIFCCFGYSQIKPVDLVNSQKDKVANEPISLFTPNTSRNVLALSKEFKNYNSLKLNESIIARVLNQDSKYIEFKIEGTKNENKILQLVEVSLGNTVLKVAPSMETAKRKTGKHYRGIVKGDQQSIVSLSIFDDEVMGFYSETKNNTNYVIGKMEESDDYIIYEDKDIADKLNFQCNTTDSYEVYTEEELASDRTSASRALSDCVRFYFEIDYDIYQNKGSVDAVNNYITGLYNQVATLYANENINTSLSELVIWNQPSPYSATSAVGYLNAFTANRDGFNGDLAMLISYKTNGGVAYVDGLCRSNTDYSMGFASITSSYSTVPTYSWAVNVLTHELGHLFGSQHTHACVWNGNSTAIDNCADTEDGCTSNGTPNNGGTIMSYCHLTNVGINFSNGFGTQPGNLIRNKVSNANCLDACTNDPPDDGGGDPTTCEDNEVVITINVDNYPAETTWSITDANGNTVLNGGPYAGAGSTKTSTACLPDGCYDFKINDSYGDGICCSYGQGFYKVEFNGTSLAEGGSFTNTETKSICVGEANPPAPTCNDGIMNGEETGIDCGGPDCEACVVDPPAPTCNDGIMNGQETGVDCGGPDCEACIIDPPAPTCNDGIMNGQETGVDCGGPDCEACVVDPPTCTDITMTIKVDNYPGETTWTIKDENGNTVLSGGPYTGAGSTKTATACLPDGCYDFEIKDSYGDGICCSYGQGFYIIEENNNTLASGSAFASSESKNFCIGSQEPPLPTCEDGIMNGEETGIDCGGPECDECQDDGDGDQTDQMLMGHYFESDFDGWQDGGSDCAWYQGSFSPEGNGSIALRDNSGTQSTMTSETFDLSMYNSIELKLMFFAYSFEQGEDFYVQMFDGSSWLTIANPKRGADFNNYTNYVLSMPLDQSLINFASNAKFRITSDASSNGDIIYIDAIELTATTAAPNTISTAFKYDIIMISENINLLAAKVYPNPASRILNIDYQGFVEIEQENIKIEVFDILGKKVIDRTIENNGEKYKTLNINHLGEGNYFLRCSTNEEILFTKRFTKIQD